MMIRIVVAGSRSFDDYAVLQEKLDKIIVEAGDEVELVSGHAKGADQMAERYAAEHDLAVKFFKPDWKTYGRAAGPIRNRQMLDYAAEATPLLVAFWDGTSKGTKNTIKTARKMGIPATVFTVWAKRA